MEITKVDVINMICGAHLNGGMTECQQLQDAGFMVFCGNQHNPDWRWDRHKLNTLDDKALYEIYEVFCNRNL